MSDLVVILALPIVVAVMAFSFVFVVSSVGDVQPGSMMLGHTRGTSPDDLP